MLNIGTTGSIYVAVDSQDGRKGIDGLAGVVRTVLGRDPASGDIFVFKNRRGDKLKILGFMAAVSPSTSDDWRRARSPSPPPQARNSPSRRPNWP